jgi:arylsulfatase A-like enzyme
LQQQNIVGLTEARPPRYAAPQPRRIVPLRWPVVALLIAAAACDGDARTRERRPPVVIVSIDTLRADRLPAYGYRGIETPAIDQLVRDSIRFENAYASVPLTLPSHVSLLSGLLPPAHGVRDNIGYRVEDRIASLGTFLRPLGYESGGVVSSYVLRGSTGIGSAFEHYDDAIEVTPGATLGQLERTGSATVDAAWTWVEQRLDRPFFLFVHLFEPHAPYAPPELWAARYGKTYDGEIAAADAAVGDLLGRLRTAGRYEDALVFLLSDHGEGLGDHGEKEHGVLLYRSTLHVPLLMKLPHGRRGGETVAQPVQLLDVVPTVADVIGFDVPPDRPGWSLLRASERGVDDERHLYAETFYPRLHFGWSELRSLIGSRYHYIEGPHPELFDVIADPGEAINVLQRERRVYRELRDDLRALDAGVTTPGDIDDEEAKKLAALGYLSRTMNPPEGPLLDPRQGLDALDQIQRALDLASRDPAAAAAILERLLTRFPDMLDAHFNLASVLHRLGRAEEALEHYRRAVELAPVAAHGSLIEIGRIQLELGRIDEAERHARLVLERLPVEGHDLLCRAALARGDRAAALDHARRAVAAETVPRAESMILLARVEMVGGAFTEALDVLDRLHARYAGEGARPIPNLELERGEALAYLGRSAEAAAAFEAEIGDFPDNLTAYSKLAFVYAVLKQFDRIDPLLERMVAAQPGREALLLAADTAARLGDESGSRAWRERASALRHPDRAEADAARMPADHEAAVPNDPH